MGKFLGLWAYQNLQQPTACDQHPMLLCILSFLGKMFYKPTHPPRNKLTLPTRVLNAHLILWVRFCCGTKTIRCGGREDGG